MALTEYNVQYIILMPSELMSKQSKSEFFSYFIISLFPYVWTCGKAGEMHLLPGIC